MKLLGICGSLRVSSWNSRLLSLVPEFLPDDVRLDIQLIGDLPHYNADLDGERKPAVVQSLLDRVASADALLFVTPEYNYSIPGVLKNSIDWASRPAYKSPLAHKPAGIITASSSQAGGVRAQTHLKQVLGGTLTPVYPAPDLALAMVSSLFDSEGRLSDNGARERLQHYLTGFVAWIRTQTR